MSDEFSPSEAPGLDTRADFLRSEAFIEVDYREPRNPKKGGWYRIDFSHYDDRTAGLFTFNRIDADLRQFIGFLAGRRVIAARLFVSTSDTDAGQTMPFYLMPTLGGNDTLRGFRDIGSADRTRSWRRANTVGRSGAGSTQPSSTTPERSPTAVKILISRISKQTMASGSASTPITASSSVLMPRSGAVMASTCISSLAAFSRRAIARSGGAGPAPRVALASFIGLMAAASSCRRGRPRRAFIPTTRSGRITTAPRTRRRPDRLRTRTATTSP